MHATGNAESTVPASSTSSSSSSSTAPATSSAATYRASMSAALDAALRRRHSALVSQLTAEKLDEAENYDLTRFDPEKEVRDISVSVEEGKEDDTDESIVMDSHEDKSLDTSLPPPSDDLTRELGAQFSSLLPRSPAIDEAAAALNSTNSSIRHADSTPTSPEQATAASASSHSKKKKERLAQNPVDAVILSSFSSSSSDANPFELNPFEFNQDEIPDVDADLDELDPSADQTANSLEAVAEAEDHELFPNEL